MTGTQKMVGAGVGVSALAVLTLLLSSQSMPVLQFLFGEFRAFAQLPLFGPVVLAAAVGTIAPFWLPHLLPGSWPAHRTLRVTRLLGFGIAATMVFWRYQNAIGAQYGLFAGSLAYMGYTMLSGFVYRMAPDRAPASLVDPPDSGPTP